MEQALLRLQLRQALSCLGEQLINLWGRQKTGLTHPDPGSIDTSSQDHVVSARQSGSLVRAKEAWMGHEKMERI